MAKKTSPKKTSAKKKVVKKAVKKAAKKTPVKSTKPKEPVSSFPELKDDFSSQEISNVPYSSSTSAPVQGDNKKLPIAVIALLVIGIIVMLNFLMKKKQASADSAETTEAVGAPAVEDAPAPADEKNWATTADKKSWKDASSFCQEAGMSLMKDTDLIEFMKSAPADAKSSGTTFWSATEAGDGKYNMVSIKSGKIYDRAASKSYGVICKK